MLYQGVASNGEIATTIVSGSDVRYLRRQGPETELGNAVGPGSRLA